MFDDFSRRRSYRTGGSTCMNQTIQGTHLLYLVIIVFSRTLSRFIFLFRLTFNNFTSGKLSTCFSRTCDNSSNCSPSFLSPDLYLRVYCFVFTSKSLLFPNFSVETMCVLLPFHSIFVILSTLLYLRSRPKWLITT